LADWRWSQGRQASSGQAQSKLMRLWESFTGMVLTGSSPDEGVTDRAFGVNAAGMWFDPGSEGFFRASYSENGLCWLESLLMP
jgi:hypothetical protein